MTTYPSPRRAVFAVVSVLTAAALVTACGGGGHGEGEGDDHGGGKSADRSKGGNSADVSFAQGMIPHHRQALEMARLAPSRASSARVKSLAEDVREAQQPEITAMSGWLKSWGEKVPPGSGDGGSGHNGHAGHGMPGMMAPEDMARLKDASGEEFDEVFLKMMIGHHEGAVEMARTEKSKGSYRAAKDMARDIERSQTDEIEQMRGLLKE